MRFSALLIVVTAFLAGCSSDSKNLAAASGVPGDIYIFMDSLQIKGPLGASLDSILGAEMPGLPRKEPLFKIHWVDVRRLNYILKERRNMIFVLTLDRYSQGAAIIRGMFTPEALEKMKTAPSDYIRTGTDVFSRGQEVVYLFGKDEETLLRNIRAKGSRLVTYFDQKEFERMTKSLFKSAQMKGITEILRKDFQCTMNVPFGYKLADKGKDFLWVRQINPKDDKDVFIARAPYTSTEQFRKENLIQFRNDICRKYLFEDPDDASSYLLTETTIPFVPVTADTLSFSGRFAVRLRGLYRSNTLGIGGPFVGFAMVDDQSRDFYYIEGFTISPGRDQREIMRELETILFTFKCNQSSAESKPPQK